MVKIQLFKCIVSYAFVFTHFSVSSIDDNEKNIIKTTPNMTCKDHEGEKLSIFCTTCDTLTCRTCHLSGAHKSHQYKFTADILPGLRLVYEFFLL